MRGLVHWYGRGLQVLDVADVVLADESCQTDYVAGYSCRNIEAHIDGSLAGDLDDPRTGQSGLSRLDPSNHQRLFRGAAMFLIESNTRFQIVVARTDPHRARSRPLHRLDRAFNRGQRLRLRAGIGITAVLGDINVLRQSE